MRERQEEVFIIMDNSVIEMGEAMHAIDVIEAACVVEANCIMAPDALGGFEATKKLVLEQKEELQASGFPLMMVPQGESPEEIAQCIDWLKVIFKSNSDEEFWGIPRWITNKLLTRVAAVLFITTNNPNAQVHLLGMSNDYVDDMLCAGMYQVMGIDSANPVVLGQNNIDMLTNVWKHIDRGNYWLDTSLTEEAIWNVEFMHNALLDT